MTKQSEIKRLEFPKVTDADVVFGGYDEKWFNKTLTYPECDKEWGHKTSMLFFKGGKIEYNNDLPEEYINDGIRLFKAILGSFKPKHEHKINVCGQILRSLC